MEFICNEVRLHLEFIRNSGFSNCLSRQKPMRFPFARHQPDTTHEEEARRDTASEGQNVYLNILLFEAGIILCAALGVAISVQTMLIWTAIAPGQ